VTVRVAVGALLAGVLLLPAAVRSAEPTPVDPDFLEFLGSIDSEGDGWVDYLGSVDLDKRTPPPVPPGRKPEPAPAPPVKEPVKGAGK
jgi:hypothetical protein